MELDSRAYWIIDDTGHPKKGKHSVGVASQYCGQLGKQDNCQRYSGWGRPPVMPRRTPKPQPSSVKALALGLPASAFQSISWREGSNETLSGRFAAVRVRHAGGNLGRARLWPRQWLLIEWPATAPEPTKYWLSTLPEQSSLGDLVDVAHPRWRIERDYQELKQELGLGHYEGRGWRGFHHHATLTIAAYGFLLTEQLAARSNRSSKKNSIRRHLQRRTPALPAHYVPRGSPTRAKTHAQLDHDAALPVQR